MAPTSKPTKPIVKIAFVSAMVMFAAGVINPLLQRASRIHNGEISSSPSLSMDLMGNPLGQPFGMVQDGQPANMLLLTNFIESVQEWYNNTNILTRNVTGYECLGTCEGSLTVPGLDWNCTTGSAELDFSNTANQGDFMFSVNFTRTENSNGDAVLGLDVIYSSSVDNDCIATMVIEHCDIGLALVQQDIRIQNGSISLADNPSQLLSRYSSPLDAINAPSGTQAGPLSMLNWLGVFYFESSFTLDFIGDNVASNAHGIVPSGQKYQVVNTKTTSLCDYTFTSPVHDILTSMAELLFRTAYDPHKQGQYSMATQTFPVSQTTPELVFVSDYTFAAIAVAIMILALLALIVPLWGWWELGRKVGLSPLETAKAFGAPLLKEATAANDADDLIDLIGDTKVAYGKILFSIMPIPKA